MMLVAINILWFNLAILDLNGGGVVIVNYLENFLQLYLNSEYGEPHIGGQSAHLEVTHHFPVSWRQLGNGAF